MFQFVKQHIIISVAFAAALALTLFFTVRLTVSTIIWSDPDRYEQPIAGWMTPRYVSRSWGVELEVVAQVLQIEMDRAARQMTIEEIAAAQGRGLDTLILELDTALVAVRGGTDD
ncbi:hypothetical protein [Roseinatronobacter sp. NSM]|uniref:hypothetical protein n=1 Tax=Roseinatronobacter sp. NSM TaxID=3457785 RepID=UPI004036E85C